MKMLKAILIDVGGPLVDEDDFYRQADRLILEELAQAQAGRRVAAEEYARVLRDYTARCSPNPRALALWHFLRPDIEGFKRGREALRKAVEEWEAKRVRPGAAEALAALAGRYKLALAGNQRAKVKELLQREGILRYFSFGLVSEEMGVTKPDPLFFRMILDSLAVEPEEAAMVGDRLDLDIFPARLLGLKAVRVLVGPYSEQEPITLFHEPDLAIGSLAELPKALARLEGPSAMP